MCLLGNQTIVMAHTTRIFFDGRDAGLLLGSTQLHKLYGKPIISDNPTKPDTYSKAGRRSFRAMAMELAGIHILPDRWAGGTSIAERLDKYRGKDPTGRCREQASINDWISGG